MYVIKKILNNNVVVAKKAADEVIIVGKGVGYDFKKDMSIPEERIENLFIKEKGENGDNYSKLFQKINNKVIAISEEIISYSEKNLNVKLNESIHLSLADHINFAIQRIKEGIKIENPFLNELKVLYPKEFELAQKALEIINKEFDTKLPEDEIGFICLHIRAALTKQHVGSSLNYTKKIKDIMDFILKLIDKKIDEKSFEYVRTLTHINFMLDRLNNNKPIKNELLEGIKKDLYIEYNIAIKVALRIETVFNVKVPEDEIGYIAFHLRRLIAC
ncbi:PRD domain-containing protein [Clostridium sp. MB40-C1]|uniref:PRD domain-containing protein n=1 Tax=Clostridium sp. MB40-C1 TaxID=3070996 RepID=UPI0027DF3C89|nr:PRD domain-containing protein [Clostridium sp. MB40-C1]WMJ81287.1 PRD domain-containing protein [Clostridium sp. MB40-C1]